MKLNIHDSFEQIDTPAETPRAKAAASERNTLVKVTTLIVPALGALATGGLSYVGTALGCHTPDAGQWSTILTGAVVAGGVALHQRLQAPPVKP